MKKLHISLASLTLAALAVSSASAQIISYGGDYVASGSTLNSRQWVASGEVATVSFSDTNPLDPTSSYTGPDFFGASSSRNIGGTATFSGDSSNVQHQASGFDRINLTINVASTDSGRTVQNAGLIYLKSGSSFNVTANNQFSSSLDLSFSGAQTSAARWVVRTSSGDLYVSNETFAFGAAPATPATSTGLTTTTWALLNTGGADFYQTYGTFGSLTLTGLTGAGVYWEAQRTGVNTGAAGNGARLNTFTVVPEPNALVLMLGGFGIMALRRRRA